jgi:adenylate cyclase
LSTIISDSLQGKILQDFRNLEHTLLIDNNIISNDEDLEKLIDNLYINEIFDENTKIHLKLKINLNEFLLIHNYLYPTLIKFDEIKYL